MLDWFCAQVMSIYLPSLCVLWKLAHAVATDSMLNKRFLPDLRSLLPLVVARLGDSKVRLVCYFQSGLLCSYERASSALASGRNILVRI